MDRENVVKKLETLYEKYADAEVVERHEYGDTQSADIFHNCSVLMHDAVVLLREPVKPIVGHRIGPGWWYICGECRGSINPKDNYCRHCGRKVKWDA